jgi:hypothetical protein
MPGLQLLGSLLVVLIENWNGYVDPVAEQLLRDTGVELGYDCPLP